MRKILRYEFLLPNEHHSTILTRDLCKAKIEFSLFSVESLHCSEDPLVNTIMCACNTISL